MQHIRRVLGSAFVVALVLIPGAAWAQTGPYVGGIPPELGPVDLPPEVLGVTRVRQPALDSGNASPGASDQQRAELGSSEATTAAADPALAVTGGDVVGLAMLGVAAIGGGVLLVRRSRRPATV